VTRLAGLDGPGDPHGWRVFLSHTSELREYPKGTSYVAAVERAVSASGHVIVDMADFPAVDLPAAQLCADRVRECDVYVGILGTRYGSPVRDMPQVSYTELEFDTATEAELPRLVFLLDERAADVGIPLSALIDREFGARQDAFRRRVRDSGLVTGSFASPAELRQLVGDSLRELAQTRRGGGGGSGRGQVPAVVAVGDIPQEPAGFQPRADLLAELDAPSGGRVSVVHAVTGMRGVGKTHLTATYARARIDDGWRLVAWVNAADSASVLGGLAEVAAALGLDAGTGDAAVAGRAVRHRLETGGDRCLLVFDNATNPADLLPFLPAAGKARVLITSNERPVADLGAGVAVDVFTWEEALTFLADRTGSADAGGARALATELGCLPLALAQAAAVIAAQHLDYGTYLRRLRDKPVDQLLLRTGTDRYPHGLAAAVLLALEAVRAGDGTGVCSAVMDLVSVLSAAGVPRAVLHAAGQAGALSEQEKLGAVPPDVVDEALGQLAGSSLLTFSVDGGTVTAHLLVMRVVREQLARQGHLATTCQAAARVLEARARSLRDAWQDRPARRDLVEQILAVQEYSASAPGETGSDLTQAILSLRGWAVWFLNDLGDSAAQAIKVAGSLLADQEQILGPDHPDTLASRNNLALAYRDAGRAAEAIPLHERTLADRERILGPDHPETLASRNNLARAYRAADRAAEAIPLHERAIAGRERVLGRDHPGTMQSRNNLANAYRDVGRVAEAILLYERTLADRERILGPDHPSTLTSRGNLAVAYRAAGRAAEAIPLHERTLADRERILGPDHPDTLASRDNLAAAYQEAGRAAEAIPLHERTLADRERILGPDHPDTLTSRNNLTAAKASPS
jgi:tetratricopeptide (TPR) repeat protein